MKGIILAGGEGLRLFPLTATTSKQLLPVYNRQMIFYPLNTLIKAGIKNILVIVAPDHSGQFLNLLGPIFADSGIHLEFKIQKVPRGLAEAFILGENFIKDDNVTLILGDNIFEDDMSEHIQSFKSGGRIYAKEVLDPERLGVVEFDSQMRAVSIEEKPEKPKSNWAVPGLYTYEHKVVQVAKLINPSARGELEITTINQWFLERGELDVRPIKGAWLDAGTVDSLLEAGNIVKEKKIYEGFDPLVNEAIKSFNEEMKALAKKVLS